LPLAPPSVTDETEARLPPPPRAMKATRQFPCVVLAPRVTVTVLVPVLLADWTKEVTVLL
jgi:hypothetical protein